LSISSAAASGDRLKLLRAIRGRLAEAMEDCQAKDLSPLTNRLQAVVQEIADLEEQQKQEVRQIGVTGTGATKWDLASEL
jgi:hypothetical protein